MSVTVLALVTVNDDDPMALGEYFQTTDPLLERVGAKIVQRFEVSDAVVGRVPGQMAVIVEYPSRDAVDAVFGSDEYKSIIPARDRAFLDYNVSIVAEDAPGDLPKTQVK